MGCVCALALAAVHNAVVVQGAVAATYLCAVMQGGGPLGVAGYPSVGDNREVVPSGGRQRAVARVQKGVPLLRVGMCQRMQHLCGVVNKQRGDQPQRPAHRCVVKNQRHPPVGLVVAVQTCCLQRVCERVQSRSIPWCDGVHVQPLV